MRCPHKNGLADSNADRQEEDESDRNGESFYRHQAKVGLEAIQVNVPDFFQTSSSAQASAISASHFPHFPHKLNSPPALTMAVCAS